jgi:mono/diheme cytochrome c family protein
MKCCFKGVIAIVVMLVLSVLLYRHSGFFTYSHNPMQYMPNMHHTKALIPQRGYDFYADKSAQRVPPIGTLSRTQALYPYTHETPAAEVQKFSNPFPITRETVLRGQKMFMTYCVVCHGPKGLGDGYVVPKFPQPPSLQSDKIRGYADSQIFHVITAGQNGMNSYAPQIREEDRWAIIHYVRVLQKSEHPSDDDVKAFDEFMKASKGAQ